MAFTISLDIGKNNVNVKPPSPLATSKTDATHIWRDKNKTVVSKATQALGYSDQSLIMYTNGEQSSRQRMRPWLEARINSGEIQGLQWVNQVEMIYRVPWKHVGNREWTEKDGQIFKEWAMHTGRYREGIDPLDYPAWKTRFRCALTKLPDIRELRHLNKLDGQAIEPYRVYKFLPWRRRESPTSDEFQQYSSSRSNIINTDDQSNGMITTEATIPTTVNPDFKSTSTDGNRDPTRLDSDLNNIPSSELLPCSSRCDAMDMTDQDYDMDITDELIERRTVDEEMQTELLHKANKSYFDQDLQIPSHLLPANAPDSGLYIHIRYREETKLDGLCPGACRILSSHPDLSVMDEEFNEHMFGPANAQQILLPACKSSNSKANELTAKLLNALDRGVIFSMNNGDITANRLCRCSIFVSSPSLNDGETTRLEREEPLVIFNYSYYQKALCRYINQRGPKPITEITVGFGQRFDKKDSLTNLLMSATVTHAGAHEALSKVVNTNPMSPPIEISNSNDYDKYLDQMKKLEIKGQELQV